jgi:hypothetical protein
MGESIGQRPLLSLSVLLMVIGVQILATGLIAELVVHLARNERPFVVRRVVGGAAAPHPHAGGLLGGSSSPGGEVAAGSPAGGATS